MMSILRALTHGYGPHLILNRLAKANPKYANAIQNAHAAGYAADTILRHGLDKNDPEYEETNQYLTEHEQTRKNHAANTKKAAIQAVSLLGTAGAVAAGGYQLYNTNRAIRPDAILGPQAGSGPRSQVQGRQPLQIGQPGAPAPQRPIPQHPRDPSPIRPQGGQPQPNNQPPANPQDVLHQNPIVEKNYNLVKNIGEEDRFHNIAMQGYDIATAAQILKQVTPKAKVALLEKAEGGLEGVLANFMLYNQLNPPAIREQFQPKPQQRPGQPNQPQMQQSGMQQEQMPGQPEEMQQPGQPEQMQQEQGIPFIPDQQMQQPPQQSQQGMMQPGQAQRPNLTENMQRIAGKINQPQKKTDSPQVNRDRFAIANKRHKDEKPEAFVKRKMLNETLRTAAKIIASGKDFTDLPYQKEVAYSTAKDVLKFLAGAPTAFDELLDDEEKEEIFEAGNPDGIESSLQGAHMTPNLIWNLILSINPKVTDLVPPSIKGSKGKPAGGKMSTTEARRFLTHGVARILGGKTVSFALADKIGKISQATDALDVIANAAADGNIRKIEDQLMKLDPAIFEVLESELNSKIPETFAWMRKKAGIEKSFGKEIEEEDSQEEGDMLTLYHTSADDINEIHDDGRYGPGLFFSDRPYYMTQADNPRLYSIEQDLNDIMDANDFKFIELDEYEKIKPIIKKIMKESGVDEETAMEFLSSNDEPVGFYSRLEEDIHYSDDDSEEMEEKKKLYKKLSKIDLAEFGWDLQKYALEAANKLGKKGVALKDETGTSYLINLKGKEKRLKKLEN